MVNGGEPRAYVVVKAFFFLNAARRSCLSRFEFAASCTATLAKTGTMSLRTWRTSSLNMPLALDKAVRAAVTLWLVRMPEMGETPGTGTPRDSSTARTTLTKFFWTAEGSRSRHPAVLHESDLHSPYPGVWLAFMIGSFVASIEATELNAGSIWEIAVMTPVQMRARW